MLGIQFYYVDLQSNQYRQHNGSFGVQYITIQAGPSDRAV